MADAYDIVEAHQLQIGDFALISGKEVIITDFHDYGDEVVVSGNCISESDGDFEAVLWPFLKIDLLTE